MRINRRMFTAGVAATLGSAITLDRIAAQATPHATPGSEEMVAKLRHVMEIHGVPGALFGIASPETMEPHIMSLGVADVANDIPMAFDMHMRIASITKTFVATVALQLVDEKRLTLEDTIATLLPHLPIVNADSITVRHLLGMQSGLPHIEANPDFSNALIADVTREYPLDELYGYALPMQANADPGTAFDYNNLNYNIIGDIVENLTGESWFGNVQARILDPLGLTATSVPEGPTLPQPAPKGYGYLDQAIPATEPSIDGTATATEATPVGITATPIVPPTGPIDPTGLYDLTEFNPTIAGAAGAMVSNVYDMLTWAPALAQGTLISPEMHKEQLTTVPLSANGFGGYGLGILDIHGIVGHNGAINGFQSIVIHEPVSSTSLTVLTNCHPTLGFADAASDLVSVLLGI